MHLTVIKNKLKQKYDTIIIDEASMVDINLFLELIQSIPNGSNIILVGDADQLPPIGPGQPFKDMIESKKVNISKLSGNFRQNNLSNIIKASRSIITGKLPSMETEFKNSDFIFTCVGNDNDLREVTLGDKGLFKTAKKGSIYIDNTTASANIARELYKEAKAKGFDFLDAPISGTSWSRRWNFNCNGWRR